MSFEFKNILQLLKGTANQNQSAVSKLSIVKLKIPILCLFTGI